MTISKLIKELEKLKSKVGPRTEVVIDLKGTQNSKLDEWHSYIKVNTIERDSVLWYVDDNCFLQDGSERYKSVIILNGE